MTKSPSPNPDSNEKSSASRSVKGLEPRILLSATWAEPDVDEQAEDEDQENEENEDEEDAEYADSLLKSAQGNQGLFAGLNAQWNEGVGDGQSTSAQEGPRPGAIGSTIETR